MGPLANRGVEPAVERRVERRLEGTRAGEPVGRVGRQADPQREGYVGRKIRDPTRIGWMWPGVDDAALRELMEETGVTADLATVRQQMQAALSERLRAGSLLQALHVHKYQAHRVATATPFPSALATAG